MSLDQGGDGQLTPGLRLLAGAMAGIVGMSATYPMDMVSSQGCGWMSSRGAWRGPMEGVLEPAPGAPGLEILGPRGGASRASARALGRRRALAGWRGAAAGPRSTAGREPLRRPLNRVLLTATAYSRPAAAPAPPCGPCNQARRAALALAALHAAPRPLSRNPSPAGARAHHHPGGDQRPLPRHAARHLLHRARGGHLCALARLGALRHRGEWEAIRLNCSTRLN